MSTSTTSSGAAATSAPGVNWARNYAFSAGTLHRPASLDELRAVVGSTARVRAVGTRHCFNDIADSPGDMVTLEALPTEVEVDSAAGTVRVGSATSYGVLAQRLHDSGFALAAMASLPHISVGGGVATATHGSGDRTQNLAAAVRAVELVTADGDVRRVERGDGGVPRQRRRPGVPRGRDPPRTRRAGDLRCAPGRLLGVVVRGVHRELRRRHLRRLQRQRLHELDRDGHHPGVAEDPDRRQRRGSGGTVRRLRASEPLHPLPEVDVRNATEQLGVPGPWHERLPHFRFSFAPSNGEELQVEYLVAREDALAVVAALRELGPSIAPLLHMCEIRTVAADDLWLSSAHGRDSVAFHFTDRQRQAEVIAAIAEVEAALAGLDVRPHWGKLFAADARRLADAYPRFDDARALVARHDPRRKFANAYTDRIGLTGP